MNNTSVHARSALAPERLAALETEVAQRWIHTLEDSLEALPADVQERLRFARERAVARSRAAAVVATTPLVHGVAASPWVLAPAVAGSGAPNPRAWSAGGPARHSTDGTPSGWSRWLSTLLPAVILFLGLWIAQDVLWDGQIEATAEVDTALLIDELPPQAYTDPGFTEFLRRSTSP